MIQLDISNVWGELSLPELLAIENEVAAAHEKLTENAGNGPRKWLEESEGELRRILRASEKIRKESQVCVVVGAGGGCLGARGVIELMKGPEYNLTRDAQTPLLLFTGRDLSTRSRHRLTGLLEGKEVSVIMISGSGTTLESALAFRELRWMLERKYGTDAASGRIYVVTDPAGGALEQMAEEEGWESFSVPSGLSGHYSVLTAAGLLPMAVAGLDIREMLKGAAVARECYDLRSFENPVWLYAAVRYLMQRGGKTVELLASFEPGFRTFGRWWQKLTAESEGKQGKGLFPAALQLTEDLYVLGQLVQEGSRSLFETILRFDPPENKVRIGSDWRNLDELNYLEGKNLEEVEEKAFQAAVAAHGDGGVPVICMDCCGLSERRAGELLCFAQLSSAIGGYLLGVDPFSRPGLEPYRQNLLQLLGKPGCE